MSKLSLLLQRDPSYYLYKVLDNHPVLKQQSDGGSRHKIKHFRLSIGTNMMNEDSFATTGSATLAFFIGAASTRSNLCCLNLLNVMPSVLEARPKSLKHSCVL